MNPELLTLLNTALELEHAAAIQYFTHAQLLSGPGCEPLIARLEDSAKDEQAHAAKLRTLIGDYLLAVPSMGVAGTRTAGGLLDILQTNLTSEREAIVQYQKILDWLHKALAENNANGLPYHTLEHDIRHLLMEEQEHVAELARLLR